MQANELVERYIHQVGTYLPRSNREDIQRELQSLIQDELDERAGSQEPSLEVATSVLKEFGKPAEFAARYHSQQHLIGPHLFLHFKFVVAAVWSFLAAMFVFFLAVRFWQGVDNPAYTIWQMFFSYANTAIMNLGVVTLIFALIERYAGDQIEATVHKEDHWDPLSLPAVDDPDQVRRGAVIGEIIGTTVFISVFLTLISSGDSPASIKRFVSPEFLTNLPLLVLSSVFGIMLKMFVFGQNRWTAVTRLVEIGLEVFLAVVLYRVLMAGPITTLGRIDAIFRLSFAIVLTCVILSIAYKTARQIWNWQMGTVRHSLT